MPRVCEMREDVQSQFFDTQPASSGTFEFFRSCMGPGTNMQAPGQLASDSTFSLATLRFMFDPAEAVVLFRYARASLEVACKRMTEWLLGDKVNHTWHQPIRVACRQAFFVSIRSGLEPLPTAGVRVTAVIEGHHYRDIL